MKIGIDIGGTHTDAVLVGSGGSILAAFKTKTTASLEEGVKIALEKLLQKCKAEEVKGIFVGTTHATNAILERKELYRVGLIRIAGHRPDALRPCFSWPEEMRQAVFAGCETIDGGFECDGRSITRFSRKQVREALERLKEKGAESIAVAGVFSPLCPDQELECASEIEGIPLSLSHKIGGVGFIERENAAILNAALKRPMERGFRRLEEVRDFLGMRCPLYVTQNDGSLIGIAEAIEYPLLTVSAGPTNSFIGARQLANVLDAVIVDVGGTSTDIGLVRNGYPQRSLANASIGGISLNFRMPDLLALAIGGGSYVEAGGGVIAIGPRSAGAKILQQSLIFGGSALTLTDVACLEGSLVIPEAKREAVTLSHAMTKEVMSKARSLIANGVERMRGKRKEIPVLAVGGGAPIAKMEGWSIPEFAEVANAYGAALAEVAATVERVVTLNDREKILDDLKAEAVCLALERGAANPRIVDLKVVPYHYMPNRMARVTVTASGPQEGA